MALGKGLNSLIPQEQTKTKKRKRTRKQRTDLGSYSSDASDQEGERIWKIPISDIVANAEQPRRHFDTDALGELAASIEKHGIMQPLTVTERDDGTYELIAGERRLRAAQQVGFARVPAVVRPATEQEKLELALIENIQRQELNPIEEAFAFQRLIEEFGLSQSDVAGQVGKSRPMVANTIRLLRLPDPIQKALMEGKISMGKARALLSLKTEAEQLAVFEQMIGQKASVRDIEEVVQKKSNNTAHRSRRDPNIVAREEQLEEKLGTKVRITQRGEKGKVTIHFSSLPELKRVLDEIQNAE